jgi:hypothetical protein
LMDEVVAGFRFEKMDEAIAQLLLNEE